MLAHNLLGVINLTTESQGLYDGRQSDRKFSFYFPVHPDFKISICMEQFKSLHMTTLLASQKKSVDAITLNIQTDKQKVIGVGKCYDLKKNKKTYI